MRWRLAILAVAACGKSHPKSDPAPGPIGGDPRPAATADAAAGAAPAAADAAVEAAPAELPPGTSCTGRWTARVNFDSNHTCAADQLAPYTDVDVTLAAGAQGWTATVAGPAGLAVDQVHVEWQDQGPLLLCRASIWAHKPGAAMRIDVSRWQGAHANARLELGDADTGC
ncbi:MAG TPA: hypothetical protein VL172_01815, partial [Kofleriaceae bacterium]|nr:hypothetical protein [Kofleriaceae bacterium]